MNHSETHSAEHTSIEKLEKLYQNKCIQAEKAKAISNTFMYQVFKAEADNIRSVIDQY